MTFIVLRTEREARYTGDATPRKQNIVFYSQCGKKLFTSYVRCNRMVLYSFQTPHCISEPDCLGTQERQHNGMLYRLQMSEFHHKI